MATRNQATQQEVSDGLAKLHLLPPPLFELLSEPPPPNPSPSTEKLSSKNLAPGAKNIEGHWSKRQSNSLGVLGSKEFSVIEFIH